MADYTSTVELKANTGKLEQSMKRVNGNLNKMNTRLRASSGQFKKTTTSAGKDLKKLDTKLTTTTKLVSGLGAAFAALAAGTYGADLLRQFSTLEDGLKQIATLGVKDLKKVEKAVFKTAKLYGSNLQETTKGYYDIISAGASSGTAAVEQLNAAAKLAAAGNTDLAGSIDVVTSGLNVWKDSGMKASEVTDKLFLAVKFGKTTVEELGRTFGMVAPIVKTAGGSMDDYAASMAVITAGGIATNQATTGLSAIMSNLVKVTPAARTEAKRLGLDWGTAAIQADGFVGVLENLQLAIDRDTSAGTMADKLGKLFDSKEAIGSVSVLLDNLDKLKQVQGDMATSAGTVDEAWKKVADNMSILFNRVRNSVIEVEMTITELIIKPLKAMARSIAENGEGWRMTKKVMVAATTAASGFLAVLSVKAIRAITIAMANLTRVMITNPLFMGLVGAGYGLTVLLDQFDAFEGRFMKSIDFMALAFENFVYKVTNWAGIKLGSAFDIVGDAWQASLDTALVAAEATRDFIKAPIKAAFTYVNGLDWEGAWGTFGTAWTAVKTTASKGYDLIAGGVEKAYNYLTNLDWLTPYEKISTAANDAFDLLGDGYDFIAGGVEKAWNYLSTLDWLTPYEKISTAANKAFDLLGDGYDLIAGGIEKAWNYLSTLDWLTPYEKISDAANKGFALLGDGYDLIAAPVEKAYNKLISLDWSAMWADFITESGTVYDFALDFYDLIAGPIEKVVNYISNITWSDMWSGLSGSIDTVNKWFWDMYIYLVGNSVVPDMVNEIMTWFGTMATGMVAPVISVYDAVTGWFTKMYHKVTGTTKDTVTEINASLSDVHGFEPADTDGLFDPEKLTEMLKSWDELSTKMKVAVGIAGTLGAAFVTAFAIAKVTQFKNSINGMFDTFRNSTKTISGKQGLLNKIMYGTEGGDRRAGGEAAKLDKKAKLLDQGVRYRAAQTAAERKAALQGYSFFERSQIKKNATLRTAIMQHQAANARSEMVKLQAHMDGRGAFSRALFGRGSKDTLLEKVKGFAGQTKKSVQGVSSVIASGAKGAMHKATFGFTGASGIKGNIAAVTASVKLAATSMVTGLGRGAMSLATFGKKGVGGLRATLAGFAGSVRATSASLKLSLQARSIANLMLFGKTGKAGAVLASWTAFKTKLTGKNAKLFGAGALGLAGLAVAGTTAAGGLDGVKEKWDKFTQDLSFDKIKETATNAFAEYGTDGLMMWAMFGAPGSGLIVSGIAAAFTGLKAALALALAPAIGWLATTGAAILAGPVGWIGLALAGIGLAAYALWPKIEPVFTEMWDSLETWFSEIKWIEVFTKIGDILLWPEISGAFDTMWTGISTFFKEIDWSGIWDGLLDSAASIAKDLATKLNPLNWISGAERTGDRAPTARANGGMVFGPGSETSDSIPALLSNGEFVVNAKSTRKNRALLESLNSNRYASGGLVDGNSDIVKRIKKEESWKSTAYLDSLDKPTIGYGRLLSNKTMTQSEMKKKFGHLKETEAQSLQNAIDYVNKTAVPDARKFVGSKNYDGLASNVQDALISAAYNIGGTKLSKFAKFRKALVSKNNPEAAFQLLDSNAATQAVFRYAELAQLILDGKNPDKLPKRYLKTLIKRKQAKLPIPDGYGSFVSKYAEGGHVRGAGSGTSDSIPALLSNGEFVVRASQASKHAQLLKSINTPGFAEGTDSFRGDNSTITKLLIKAANKQIQSLKQNNKLFTKMIARDANSEKILFDDKGSVDAEATIAMFAKYFKEDEGARDTFISDMKKLQRYSDQFAASDVDVRKRDSFRDLNEEIKLAIEQKREEYAENEKILQAKRIQGLKGATTKSGSGGTGEGAENEFKGFGQTLTGPLKDALSRGDFKSIGDAIGEGIRGITQRISSKLLDRAFDSFEKGIDQWLLSLDKMEVEGEGMFSRLGNVFSQVMSSISSSGLGQGIGSAVSGIGSAIFGMLGGGMPTFATGGQISGAGTGTSDSIMARVSNGEFVVNAKAAKANLALLHQINGSRPSGNIPQFATGGSVNTGAAGSNGDIYLTLNNNYDVQSAMNPQEFQAMMANNAELSFLSVEKKLRETGRSLYKQG